MRRGWIYYADGTVVEKGSGRERHQQSSGPAIIPDQGDFVSPIDGKTYSGRAGMREHCRIHNVVSNLELTGLPVATVNRGVPDQRSEIRASIVQAMRKKGYL